MNRILTALLLFSIALCGCATTTPNVEPRLTIVDIPEIGQISIAEVGSTLVQKARVFEYDAYELLTTYEHKSTGYRFTAQPGLYAATKTDSRWIYYIAVEPLVETCGLGLCIATSGGFMVSRTTDEIRLVEHMNVTSKPKTDPNWRKTTYVALDEPSLRRELIYNGRAGNTIRLLYREFSRDMIRPAFSQELTYDLDEDNIIGFQGVRIEILETSNVNITYRLLNGFPDWEAIL